MQFWVDFNNFFENDFKSITFLKAIKNDQIKYEDAIILWALCAMIFFDIKKKQFFVLNSHEKDE